MIRRWLARSPWQEEVYWCLDLETTGLSPRRDSILAVGMVPIRDGAIRWGERYETLVRGVSGGLSSADAMRVHQILPSATTGAPDEAEVVEQVASRLRGAVLVVHHARVDVRFLRRAFRRTGRRWLLPDVVDTARLLARLSHRRRRLDPGAEPLPPGLGAARAALGLPSHGAHDALMDAVATAELFLVLRSRLGVTRLGQLL